MTLIECIRGETTTEIAGETYHFTRDTYGRYVARVHRHEHAACLLSVEHYREAPDVPQDAQVTMMTADTALLLAQAEKEKAPARRAPKKTPDAPQVPGAPVSIGFDPGFETDVPQDTPGDLADNDADDSVIDDSGADDSGEDDFSDDFDDDAGASEEPDSAPEGAEEASEQPETKPKRRGRPRKTAEA